MEAIRALRPSLSSLLDALVRRSQAALGTPLEGPPPALPPMFPDGQPDFSPAEAFQATRDARAAARPPADSVLHVLEHALASLTLQLRTAPHDDEIEAAERAPLALAEEPLSVAQARRALLIEGSRSRRERLTRALATHERTSTPLHQRRWEAATEGARSLGQADLVTLWADVPGVDLAALDAQAAALLAQTDDAYRDLLSYVLRRGGEGSPRGSGAARHDLLHALHSAALPAAPDAGAVWSAAQEWLAELRLPHPSRFAVHRSRITERARPSEAVDLGPGRVALYLTLGPGSRPARELLAALALAERAASRDVDDPPEAGRLLWPAVSEAYRSLFAGLLAREEWSQRYLGLSRPAARELARLATFDSLAAARADAAELRHALNFLGTGLGAGPSLAAAEAHAEAMQRALRVEVDSSGACLDPFLGAAARLEGTALAARLERQLEERFDGDFFRNPAWADWLSRRFRDGARVAPEALTEGARPTLTEAAALWMRRLGN